jgi:hypothetical protein
MEPARWLCDGKIEPECERDGGHSRHSHWSTSRATIALGPIAGESPAESITNVVFVQSYLNRSVVVVLAGTLLATRRDWL